MRALVLGAVIAGLTTGAAWAAPRTYTLPDPTAQLRPPTDGGLTAGYEAAQANCQTCHSVDYIATQPPGRVYAYDLPAVQAVASHAAQALALR